jgi:hypothetical protein
MKLEFSRQIFEKDSNMNFLMKLAQWNSNYSMGTGRRTDRHDEVNSRFSQFLRNAPKSNLFSASML